MVQWSSIGKFFRSIDKITRIEKDYLRQVSFKLTIQDSHWTLLDLWETSLISKELNQWSSSGKFIILVSVSFYRFIRELKLHKGVKVMLLTVLKKIIEVIGHITLPYNAAQTIFNLGKYIALRLWVFISYSQ